ncbi:MAG: DUF6370 family protein [Gemmataceae bacterium]
MKAAFKTLLCLGVVFAAVAVATAAEDDKKDEVKTLKGELGCGKCVFKVAKGKCVNCIKVKDGDKEVVYFLDDAGPKAKYHGKICTDSAKGSVKGKVSKKDDKMIIKPEKDGVKFED